MEEHDYGAMEEYLEECPCESGEKVGNCCHKEDPCPCGDISMTVSECGMQDV